MCTQHILSNLSAVVPVDRYIAGKLERELNLLTFNLDHLDRAVVCQADLAALLNANHEPSILGCFVRFHATGLKKNHPAITCAGRPGSFRGLS